MPSLLKKNVAYLSAVQVANYALPLIYIPFMSRIIGPAKFGTINFAAAFVTYFSIIVTYSFEFTAVRRISTCLHDKSRSDRVVSEIFFCQCVLLLFTIVVFTGCLLFIEPFRSNRLLFGFSYLTCFSMLFTQNWLYQAKQQLGKVAVLNLISKFCVAAAVLLFIRRAEDYIFQPLIIGATNVIISIASLIWAFRIFDIGFVKVPLRRVFLVIYEDRAIFFSLVFASLYTYSNTFLLGLFKDSAQVGYFTAGQRLITVSVIVLTSPMATAFYPKVTAQFASDKESGLELVRKLIGFTLVFLGCACCVIFLAGPLAIRIFYGAEFERSVQVFQILAFYPLLYALNNALGVQLMLNLKLDRVYLRVSMLAALLSLGLNFIIVPKMGYTGTAMIIMVVESVILLTMLLVIRRLRISLFHAPYFNPLNVLGYLIPKRKQ